VGADGGETIRLQAWVCQSFGHVVHRVLEFLVARTPLIPAALVGRSRDPPNHHTSALPLRGLRGVDGLKQLPKPVRQQFDGLPQGAELPNPDHRDGSV